MSSNGVFSVVSTVNGTQAGVVQGNDGYFYGVTDVSVYRVTSNGVYSTLHSFSGSDGACPKAGLIQGSDGYFYGTTSTGGTNNYGTVFKISSDHVFSVLHWFDGTNGASPQASLIQGIDGYFYGTTYGGGTNGNGTVFQISSNGVFSTIYNFTGGADGANPTAGLIQGSDGYFYGTTYNGGTTASGTVYQISSNGILSTLHQFSGGIDGGHPMAGLIQGLGGYFYGTTYNGAVHGSGATDGMGTIYQVSSNGVFSVVHTFVGIREGAQPKGGLFQASDGYLYGTTFFGNWNPGNYNLGTVFKFRPAWTNDWITSTDGKWETQANWSLGMPSNIFEVHVITNGNAKTVSLDAATATLPGTLTIQNLTVSAPSGSTNTLFLNNMGTATPFQVLNQLKLNSGGVLLVSNSALFVEGGSNCYLTVTDNVDMSPNWQVLVCGPPNPSRLVVDGSVDILEGGTAFIRDYLLIGENGTGAVWLNGGQLIATNILTAIGFLGPGQMTISNGTVLVGSIAVGCYTQGVAATDNALTVVGGQLITAMSSNDYAKGNGAAWVPVVQPAVAPSDTFVGCSGSGQMTVGGGTVTLNSLLSIGSDKSTGSVWVTAGQLAVTNGDTFVGCSGSGQMIVSNGTVMANAVYVGSDPFVLSARYVSSGAATGIVAGVISEGTLTVAGGMMALNSSLLVGADTGATGVVWATGGEIVTTNDTTAIGYAGIGRMTVSNGTVQALGMFVGQLGGSQGTLTMAGGDLVALGNVVVGDCATNATGQVILNGGNLFAINSSHTAALDVRNGTVVLNSGLLVVDTLIVTNPCGRFIRNGGMLIVDNLVLDPNLSAVGDSIPNGWKQQYGLDPFDPNVASEDPDGDGFTNLQEFLAGTDPTKIASYFHITSIARTGDDLRVTWMMGPGRTNALEATVGGSDGSYGAGNFADIFVVTNTVGSVTNYLDIGGATNVPGRFYRVRVVPSP